ncbi:MAG TPA: ROK family protein [Chitinophagaceae bacterium]|jgi:glucokinase
MSNTKKTAIGVDIGGTHITTALIDLENGNVLPGTKVRETVDANADADRILESWYAAIDKTRKQSPAETRRVGFAMPGPFDYENGVSLIRNLHKYDALYGLNIKELLSDRLGIDSAGIIMRNDTEAFLEGERMSGAAQGYAKAIGITMGTGLGSAKSAGGITLDVNLGSSPFHDSIADDYLSTRWFVKRYRECCGDTINGVKELLELREGPNKESIAMILEEFHHNLALFLRGFIAAEAPDVVVIGGNIAGAYELFYPPLLQLLNGHSGAAVFEKAQLGEDAALIGAVSHWIIKNKPEKNESAAIR